MVATPSVSGRSRVPAWRAICIGAPELGQ